jgi:hypothetical protein
LKSLVPSPPLLRRGIDGGDMALHTDGRLYVKTTKTE